MDTSKLVKPAIDQLHYEKILLKERLQKIYESIYNDCVADMRLASADDRNEFMFTVPQSIQEEPKNYNIAECIYYLITRLRKEGCSVQYTYPNFLFISWVDVKKEEDLLKKVQFLCYEDLKSRLVYAKNGTLSQKIEPPRFNPNEARRITYN